MYLSLRFPPLTLARVVSGLLQNLKDISIIPTSGTTYLQNLLSTSRVVLPLVELFRCLFFILGLLKKFLYPSRGKTKFHTSVGIEPTASGLPGERYRGADRIVFHTILYSFSTKQITKEHADRSNNKYIIFILLQHVAPNVWERDNNVGLGPSWYFLCLDQRMRDILPYWELIVIGQCESASGNNTLLPLINYSRLVPCDEMATTKCHWGECQVGT